MRSALLAVTLGLVVLAACRGGPTPGAEPSVPPAPVQRGEVRVDGHARTYRVFSPASLEGLDVRPPLVVALHDAFSSAEQFQQATQLDEAATAGQFVVVYPHALDGTWNGGFCCGRARADDEDVADVAFLARLLDELERSHHVDTERVYATGSSNGAIMAYRAACDLPERFAAVASVGGAMAMEGCTPSQPVSVLAVHGTQDGHVPYEGGPTSGAPQPVPGQPELIGTWARLNGCADEPERDARGRVRTVEWKGCRDGTRVRLVTVEGGGHTWFSEEFGDGPAGAIDATDLVTDFFGLS